MTHTMKRHNENRLSLPNLGGVKPPVMMLLMLMVAGVEEMLGQISVRLFGRCNVNL